MDKKDGGKISHWQLHHLELGKESLEELKKLKPHVLLDPCPMIVTGTVVDEPTGRWKPGNHFRSSLIVKIEREKNYIETENTIYHFDPETENKDCMPDLGNGVLSIFY